MILVGTVVAARFFRFGYAGYIHKQERIFLFRKVEAVLIEVGRRRQGRCDIAHGADEIAPDEEAAADAEGQGDEQRRPTEGVMRIIGLAIGFIIGQQFTGLQGIGFESLGIFLFFQQGQEFLFQDGKAAFIADALAHDFIGGYVIVPRIHRQDQDHIAVLPVCIGAVQELIGIVADFYFIRRLDGDDGQAHAVFPFNVAEFIQHGNAFTALQELGPVSQAGRIGGQDIHRQEEQTGQEQQTLGYISFHGYPSLHEPLGNEVENRRQD